MTSVFKRFQNYHATKEFSDQKKINFLHQKSVMKKYIIPISILLTIIIVNILTPFNRDTLVSFGAIFQADHLGDFPYNIYHSWNLRGIGYKYLLYIIYQIIDLFVTKSDYRLFQIFAHSIYYIFFFSLSFFFFKISSKFLEKYNVKWYNAYLVFLLSVIAYSNLFVMQADEAAIFLVLGMTSFSISEKRYFNYLSGIFIPLLLMCKLISVLLVSYPFFILLFHYKSHKDQIKHFVISCLLFSFLTILFYLFVIPQEITDTLHAMLFQSSFNFEFKLILRFIRRLIQWSFFAMPFLFVGILSFIIILIKSRGNRKIHLFLFLIISVPVLSIFIQKNMFQTHYLALVPFSLLSVFILNEKFNNIISDNNFILSLFLIVFVSWFSFTIIDSDWPKLKYLKTLRHNDNYIKIEESISYADKKYHLSNEDEILFLSDGTINFFIHTKSYLRHFFPLPLQRIKKTNNLFNTPIYKKVYNEVLSYSGKYIFLQPRWFDLPRHPLIHKKILNEYLLIYSFKMKKGMHQSDNFEIYRRKA